MQFNSVTGQTDSLISGCDLLPTLSSQTLKEPLHLGPPILSQDHQQATRGTPGSFLPPSLPSILPLFFIYSPNRHLWRNHFKKQTASCAVRDAKIKETAVLIT